MDDKFKPLEKFWDYATSLELLFQCGVTDLSLRSNLCAFKTGRDTVAHLITNQFKKSKKAQNNTSYYEMNLKIIAGIAVLVLLAGVVSSMQNFAFAQSSTNKTKLSTYEAKKLAAEKAAAKAKEREAARKAAAENKVQKLKEKEIAKKDSLDDEAQKAQAKLQEVLEENQNKSDTASSKQKTAKEIREEAKAEREKNKEKSAEEKSKAKEAEKKAKQEAREAKKKTK